MIEKENKLLIKNQELLKSKNKELRAAANETGRYEGAFRKLNQRRTEAAKHLKNLIASEKASTREIQKAQRAFDGLDKKVQKANRSARQFQSNVGNYPKLFGASTRALGGFLAAFGVVGGLQLFVGAVKDAFRVIVAFDKQIIAVQKTTNLTNEEIKLFKEEVIELGLALKGVSIQGLLKSAEVAGQLGIKGRENILKFSEVIEKLKLTSDIAGEESVRSFAKFIEISTDVVGNADRLGSVITELGNNFATSESQILKNTIEIQKGIAIYDANAASVIGLGAATNALGAEAEQSRSALQTTFKVLNDGASSGKNLDRILRLTGQTAKEFKEEFGADSVRVFQRFIEGLANSVDEGENLSNTLSDLGLNQKRTGAVIGVLAKNYGVLEDALGRANREYEENNALNKEAALSAKSIDSLIKDVSDSWAGFILRLEDGSNVLGGIVKSVLIGLANDLTTLSDILTGTDRRFENWKQGVEDAAHSSAFLKNQVDELGKKIDETQQIIDTTNYTPRLREATENLEGFIKQQEFLNNLIEKQDKKKQDDADAEILRLKEVAKAKETLRLAEIQKETEKQQRLRGIRDAANQAELDAEQQLNSEIDGDLDFWIDEEIQANIDKNNELYDINKDRLEREAKDQKDHLDHMSNLFEGFAEGESQTFEEMQKDRAKVREEILMSSVQLLSELGRGFTETKIQQLSDESNALELQRQTQLENAKGDKDKEAQINAEFDKKQAAIKQKQFQAEQRGALFQIAINTGVAITKTAAQLGFVAAIPFMALALALGLAQAAFVKAQKPPKFAKGSKGLQKDTYAEVGEAGRELLFMPGGGVALAQESTKAVLPKGTAIKTNKETEQILAANQLKASRENDIAARSYGELAILSQSIAEDRKSILDAVNDRDQYVFEVSKDGVKALMKNSRGTTTYLDNRFR